MPAKMTLNDTKPCVAPKEDQCNWISGVDREDIISILDNAPYGIVINNDKSDGEVLYINQECYSLIGYLPSEVPTGRIAQKSYSPAPFKTRACVSNGS